MTKEKQNWPKALANAINLATSVAMAVAVGIFGGIWLDDKFNTNLIFTLLGSVLGLATAGKMMWDRLNESASPPGNNSEHTKNNKEDS